MSAFAPLSRPSQSAVKLDTSLNRPQPDGFTYPAFRLLNKQTRVTLSQDPLQPTSVRKVFATANAHGGWFAATTSTGLIISKLGDLRQAFNDKEPFQPQRTLPCTPIVLAFACNDTRLLAGTEQGQILVFDTAQLFASSSAQVEPIQVFQESSSPPVQILPNPSNEPDLAQLVAIVRSDGTVQMLDMQMQSKGAWAGTDFENAPVAASWSPKGKQLAIALRTGDILTFGTTNNATPLKHIPATANSPLVSLQWIGPTFTFRTSYGSNTGDPPHHIVSLDSRSNVAAFVQLTHPFPLPDRQQSSQVLILHRWDQDPNPPSGEEAKALIVVGDLSSTDLEVLGNSGSRWFQQSQENPLSVPLDKNDEDTFLLALDVDLTAETPIMYAYLNDGTVQGWHISHPESKPYAGLSHATQPSPSPGASAFGQPTSPTPSAFGAATTSAFGQPSPSFGQSSAFPQKPAFGQSAFGSSSSGFGSSGTTSAFGQSSFGSASKPASAFGSSATTSAFGSSNSGGFGAFASSPSAFGATSPPPTAPPLTSTPSVSMGEATPSAFGGLSLGGSDTASDNNSKAVGGGIFGSPSPLPLPPNHPANQVTPSPPASFSDPALVKPAGGFGAFGAVTGGAFANPKQPSAFGAGGAFSGGAFSGGGSDATSGTATTSAFGKPSFGSSAFGQTGFGQKPASAFGQTGFSSGASMTPASAPASGGFSGFATGATGFGNTSASGTPSTSSGGFGAFASGTTAFGAAASSNNSATSPTAAPTSAFGAPSSTTQSAFGGGGASAFNRPTTPPVSAFGATSVSAFGSQPLQSSVTSSPDSPRDGGADSPNDSPPPAAPKMTFTTSNPPTTTGAFGNLKSASSGFKLASGFGAFGSAAPTSSPFLNTGSPTKPAVSAFSGFGGTPPATPSAATASPAFGSPSVLGGAKSAFSPASPSPTSTPTPPVSGGFGAFGGSPVGLAASTTPAKSFGDLLKIGDEPKSVFSKPQSATPIKPVSVFSPPPKEAEDGTPKSKEKEDKEAGMSGESSFGTLSQSSSFVDVSGEAEDADGEVDDEDDGEEDHDADSFLSESFESDSEPPDDDDDDDPHSPSPSAVPLPPSRSPSSTPRAEAVPEILVSKSPTPSEDSDSSEGRLSTIREESTTPPGSPEKNQRPPESPPKTPVIAPAPVAPSPFGIGLGRPSTRPTRSSPLANAPVSGDEEEKQKSVQEEKTPKPRPASPKTVFGVLPTKTAESDEEPKSAKPARPKTPPLSALSFGSSAPKMPLAGAPLPSFTKTSPGIPSPSSSTPLTGFFGQSAQPATATSPPLNTPATVPKGFFGQATTSSGTPPPNPATPAFSLPKGLFGQTPPAGASSSSSPTTPVPLPAPQAALPNASTPLPASQRGLFGSQPVSGFPKTPSPLAAPPEASMEEGMQKECALLFTSMTRELEDFRLLAQAANQRRVELTKSAGGSKRSADLSDKAKWALPDALQFGKTMRVYERDLEDLKEDRLQRQKLIRELQSNLLKAGTRREEIGRFLKAQHDNDFAKMLKSRTLGPEHLETQTQLRRSIRAMQDRIQKLEAHLQESKKRLSRANSGNPGLRAPTLDTLNRTFRNMDIALDNQTNDVDRLAARIAKIDMKESSRGGRHASTRDARLPDPVSRQRPFDVTPHVAVTTAAALNAERSAHKLKRALLAVRKEPLLNTQAASASPAPLAFKTPQAQGPGFDLGLGSLGPQTPIRAFSVGSFSPGPETPPMAGFDFPEDNFNPSPPPPVRRGAGGSGKTRVSASVPLKRTAGTPATPSPPSFDWGPLPDFQRKTTTTSPENFLSGSWVSEGFGKK
ncbi:hypothetical protein FB45DRAFT_819946 [Roridomyces roridus]|uniref:Nucleoporin Nup159/Nup146 N-terminal domain-containing protein n=1 Tax=Roridomyces roridus TaxID=1738132 RepID=A0AAD7FYS8_9AGAR|nr:hypothetical protein FB45DRAFT_819946 [Roridomyces roridus]